MHSLRGQRSNVKVAELSSALLVPVCRSTRLHGLAIACRPSVCLSVCDVGGSRPHRLKILETNCVNN